MISTCCGFAGAVPPAALDALPPGRELLTDPVVPVASREPPGALVLCPSGESAARVLSGAGERPESPSFSVVGVSFELRRFGVSDDALESMRAVISTRCPTY